MNKLKQIGLTALAGSLVATSVFAGEMAVTGSASMEVQNVSGGTTGMADSNGKAWSMGNSIFFNGSGELDNGLTVALYMELDQGAADGTNGTFDSHNLKVSSDAIGSFTFAGHGGSTARGAVDDVVTGDLWDSSFGIKAPSGSAGGNNIILYTLPTLMDGVKLSASYTPDSGIGSFESSKDLAVEYTGIEGLTLGYAIGENNKAASATADIDTAYATYAIGSITVGYTVSEYDSESVTTTADQDYMAWEVAYTMTDNISVSYGVNEISRPNISSDVDVKVSGVTATYTAGGMTVGGRVVNADNTKFGTSTAEDRELWELSLSFAF